MFTRHHQLSHFGTESQSCLHQSKVLIVGCGGIGCSAALYLACSGVGTIGIMDKDTVECSNLHRQIAHTHEKVGQLKVDSLEQECKERYPSINIKKYPFFAKDPVEDPVEDHVEDQVETPSRNIEYILKEYDICIDCTDNASARCLLNRLCVKYNKPFVFGSAIGWEGQVSLCCVNKRPCLECIFPKMHEMKDRCTTRGVLGPVPGLIGTLQSIECIKYLIRSRSDTCSDTRSDTLLDTRFQTNLLLYSAWDSSFQSIEIERDPECRICGIKEKENEIVMNLEVDYSFYLEKKKDINSKLLCIDCRVEYDENESILGSVHLPTLSLNYLKHGKVNQTDIDLLQIEKYDFIFFICEWGEVSASLASYFITNYQRGTQQEKVPQRDTKKLFYSIKGGYREIYTS